MKPLVIYKEVSFNNLFIYILIRLIKLLTASSILTHELWTNNLIKKNFNVVIISTYPLFSTLIMFLERRILIICQLWPLLTVEFYSLGFI